MNSTAKDALTGNLACLAAYLIFGFNIVCCKNIANDGHVPPMSLFLMRSAGALVLFWVMSLCLPEARRERVERGDLWKIAVASLLGLFLTQFAFLKAITMTTAVDASVLGLMTPVMTMVVAAVVLKDRITWQGGPGAGCESGRGAVHRAELCNSGFWGGAHVVRRGAADVCQCYGVCLLCGCFQAHYTEIPCGDVHEVDVPLLDALCAAVQRRGAEH